MQGKLLISRVLIILLNLVYSDLSSILVKYNIVSFNTYLDTVINRALDF